MEKIELNLELLKELLVEYEMLRETFVSEKDRQIFAMGTSVDYFRGSRPNKYRMELSLNYNNGNGYKFEKHISSMITTMDYAEASLTELRQECEKVGSTVGAFGSGAFSNKKFMYDDSVKKEIVSYSNKIYNESRLLYKTLMDINNEIAPIVEVDFSSQIQSGRRQMEQIRDFVNALINLGKMIMEVIEKIIAQLSRNSETESDTESDTDADTPTDNVDVEEEQKDKKYPLVDPEQINNYVKYKKYYNNNIEMLNQITKVDYDKFGDTVTKFKDAYFKNIDRYEMLSEKIGIPPELIAVIHYRENTKDYLDGTFNCYLHNGQTLGSTTTIVPKGKYFTDFDEAAIDAITEKLNTVPLPFGENTDIATMLTFAESYNGFGYAMNGYVNPYLYSGTNVYEKGKYVQDGKYDPNAVDKQVGVYVLLESIINDSQ